MLCAKKIEGPSKSRQTFVLRSIGRLSIQPKIQEISVGTSNGTDHFGLVRPEYSGPALKMVHFDRTGHFGRSVGPKCPFPFDKIVVPSTALMYYDKNNGQMRGGLGGVRATDMYSSIGT